MKNKKIIIYLLTLFSLLILTGCSDNYFLVKNPTDNAGNIEVAIQDQHTQIVDLKLTQLITNISLLENHSIGDYLINISSSTVPVNDNMICLKENKSFYQGHILNVNDLGGNNYELTLDAPLDFAFSTLGGCSLRNGNWAVNGAVNPVTFIVSPKNLNNVSWDITRVILTCTGDGIGAGGDKPDLTSFMATEPITNGIVFRSVNGITKNIFVASDNFHLIGETYDLTIFDANRFGEYGVVSRRSFNGQDKNGVTIRLDSETQDTFELIVRDDLTDMTDCHAIAQGHVVEI